MTQSSLRALRILVVGDNEPAIALTKEILWNLGVRSFAEATNALDALKTLRRTAIDLMISDLDMAPVDGLTLARLIRTSTDSPNPALPIILLGCDNGTEAAGSAERAGADAYLAKPLSSVALHGGIVKVLAGRRKPAD